MLKERKEREREEERERALALVKETERVFRRGRDCVSSDLNGSATAKWSVFR